MFSHLINLIVPHTAWWILNWKIIYYLS